MANEKRNVRNIAGTVWELIDPIAEDLGYIIWDAAYTMANVPYGTMLNIITTDAGERAQLSVFRSIGGAVGNILPGVILPFLIWRDVQHNPKDPTWFLDKIEIPEGSEGLFAPENLKIDPETNQVLSPLTGEPLEILLGNNVFWAALIMGVLGFVFFFFMVKNITIRGNEYAQLNSDESSKVNLIKSFGTFMKNRPAVGCTIAAMGMFIGMQSATTANTIMFATHFGQAKLSGLVMMVGFLPMFIFMPFATKLVKKYGKKEVASIGSIAGLVGAAILLIFPICPKNIQLIVYMAGLVFFGLGMGFYNCVSWAMMGDAIDYQEWKTGKREESVVYALHSFFRKLAQGVGPAAVIAIMGTALIGYDEALGTIGQSAATAQNMCWLVAILYAISAVSQFVGVSLIYNIDKKTLAKMSADLGRDVTADDIVMIDTVEENETPNR